MENSATVTETLNLIVNGEAMTSTAATLDGLVIEVGHGDSKVATAVNGSFVAERRRVDTALADGDRIEIVSPRQGG